MKEIKDYEISREELTSLEGFEQANNLHAMIRPHYRIKQLIKTLNPLQERRIKKANTIKTGGEYTFAISIILTVWILSSSAPLGVMFVPAVTFFAAWFSREPMSEDKDFISISNSIETFIAELHNKLDVLIEKDALEMEIAEEVKKESKINSTLNGLSIKASNIKKEVSSLDKHELNPMNAFNSVLPFYISNKKNDDDDLFRLDKVQKALQTENTKKTILYLVRIRSLLDNKEFFKLGVTSLTIEERFNKSTQIELIEVVKTFEFPNYLALYLEYVFIKEFKLTKELAEALEEDSVSIKFTGFTEVVRPNSIKKITHLLSESKNLEDSFNEVYSAAKNAKPSLELKMAQVNDASEDIRMKQRQLEQVINNLAELRGKLEQLQSK